jgi:tyrosinase
MTVRGASIDTTAFDDLATQVQAAMSEPSFSSFQSLINGPHGSVHGRVGGDMCCVPTASYDPIFFLHHANVDRIWARWQILHPGPLPPDEATWGLPPFNRPFSIEWQRGSDTESTDALGYRYRTFCFFLPPIRIWEVAVISWPPPIRERFDTARLVVKSDRMQVQALEVRVFVNQPKATARTKTIGNPAYAGAFGFIGHGGTEHDVEAAHCVVCAALGHDHDHAMHAAHEHTTPAGHDHDHGAPAEHGGHDHGAVAGGERFDIEFDLSAALRAVERERDEVTLKLIAVDVDGNDVAADDVLLDEIEFVVD